VDGEVLGRDVGSRVFGTDPAGYERARPGHAEEVYEILRNRCGLRPGSKVVEIGPGTGQATRRLLELGADPLVALEPDPQLAGFLRARFPDRVEIRPTTLEAAELEDDFDLAAAASSFHWVDEEVGLARLRDGLRAGGGVALWWTVFGDARRPDPFRHAVAPFVRGLPRSPSQTRASGPPFAHDGEARVAALDRAGFETIEPRRIEWTHTWDTAGIRALYASFSPILALDSDRREALLDVIARVAETDFRGRITRPVVTALYTARKPG
jgi:SAM-dependent methyltransferase